MTPQKKREYQRGKPGTLTDTLSGVPRAMITLRAVRPALLEWQMSDYC